MLIACCINVIKLTISYSIINWTSKHSTCSEYSLIQSKTLHTEYQTYNLSIVLSLISLSEYTALLNFVNITLLNVLLFELTAVLKTTI